MVDLEALREALDFYRHGSPATSHFNRIKDAACQFLRLMEGAETVWWCEVHKALRCCEAHTDCTKNEDIAYNPTACRMVKADLHIWEETL